MKFIYIAPSFPDKSLLVVASGDSMWLARCHHEEAGKAVAELVAQRRDDGDGFAYAVDVYSMPQVNRLVRLATTDEESEWNDHVASSFGMDMGRYIPVEKWGNHLSMALLYADCWVAPDAAALRQTLLALVEELKQYVPMAEVALQDSVES